MIQKFFSLFPTPELNLFLFSDVGGVFPLNIVSVELLPFFSECSRAVIYSRSLSRNAYTVHFFFAPLSISSCSRTSSGKAF